MELFFLFFSSFSLSDSEKEISFFVSTFFFTCKWFPGRFPSCFECFSSLSLDSSILTAIFFFDSLIICVFFFTSCFFTDKTRSESPASSLVEEEDSSFFNANFSFSFCCSTLPDCLMGFLSFSQSLLLDSSNRNSPFFFISFFSDFNLPVKDAEADGRYFALPAGPFPFAFPFPFPSLSFSLLLESESNFNSKDGFSLFAECLVAFPVGITGESSNSNANSNVFFFPEGGAALLSFFLFVSCFLIGFSSSSLDESSKDTPGF